MIRQSTSGTGQAEARVILSRLLRSLPAATFEMETFARLAGVVATRRVPTAAVECVYRPRLLINPDFIAAYCQRDEHLFLLVMHELWHVVLAHTSLYPRVTPAQNIAFDAIINAGLIRQFSTPEYQGFFDRLNPPDQFPHLLLRPPLGWPHQPQYPRDEPRGTTRVMQQLYPPAQVMRPTLPFYNEILELIKQDLRARGIDPDTVILIGDHQSPTPYQSRYLRDVMGGVVKRWPKGILGQLPGVGGQLEELRVETRGAAQATRQAFAQILRQALGVHQGQYRRRQRQPIPAAAGQGVMPNPYDRLMPARRALGSQSMLWAQAGTVKARLPQRLPQAHVYLDVSGSMARVLPYLLNLILPFVVQGQADVFQFSTEVEALSLASLKRGVVCTTGGTQIQCVTTHLLNQRAHIRRALILTDGYTGRPDEAHLAALRERGLHVFIVLPAESAHEGDLWEMAEAITVLPPLE